MVTVRIILGACRCMLLFERYLSAQTMHVSYEYRMHLTPTPTCTESEPTKQRQQNRKRKRGGEATPPQDTLSIGTRVFAQYSNLGYFWGNVIDVQAAEGRGSYRVGVWFEDDDVSMNCTLRRHRDMHACMHILISMSPTSDIVLCVIIQVKRDTLYTAKEYVSGLHRGRQLAWSTLRRRAHTVLLSLLQ